MSDSADNSASTSPEDTDEYPVQDFSDDDGIPWGEDVPSQHNGIQLEIADEQTLLKQNHDLFRQILKYTLDRHGVANAHISLALVDNETMHALNLRFLQHDYPTDVLSFLLSDPPAITSKSEQSLEGEIIISTEYAMGESARFGWRPEDEVTLYFVHGMLHLLGFDDHTDDERMRMRSEERLILERFGKQPQHEETRR